jgi:hypothetical protein
MESGGGEMLWPRIALNLSPAFATPLLFTTFNQNNAYMLGRNTDEYL